MTGFARWCPTGNTTFYIAYCMNFPNYSERWFVLLKTMHSSRPFLPDALGILVTVTQHQSVEYTKPSPPSLPKVPQRQSDLNDLYFSKRKDQDARVWLVRLPKAMRYHVQKPPVSIRLTNYTYFESFGLAVVIVFHYRVLQGIS